MSTSEALDFLSDDSRTGKLAWVASDGRPHVAPVWFIVEDGDLLFATGTRSGKALAMAREPRVSLVVDTETPPYAFVKVDGVVEISADPEELRCVSTLTGARYMGPDQAESFGQRNSDPGEGHSDTARPMPNPRTGVSESWLQSRPRASESRTSSNPPSQTVSSPAAVLARSRAMIAAPASW